MQGDRKHGVLALEVFRLVVFGEFDLDVLAFAHVHAHDLFFKAGDKGAAAQNEGIVFGRAALKLFSVHAAREVDGGGISVFCRAALYRHEAGVALLQTFQLRFHVLILNIILHFLNVYTLVSAQLDVGFDGNGGDENGALVADVLDGQFGLADNGEVVLFLFDDVVIVFGIEIVERVLIENTLAVVELDHVSGSLPLAESVDEIFAARLFVRFLICGFPFFRVKGHGNFDCALFSGIYFVFHSSFSCYYLPFYSL